MPHDDSTGAGLLDGEKEAGPATVLDVARLAGVSTATVSRVMSGARRVAPETAEAVKAAVRRLGFVPNRMAQGLRLGHGKTVALLVADIEQTVYSALTRHIQEALADLGLDVMLHHLSHSVVRLMAALDSAPAMRLSGVVLASSDMIDDEMLKARHAMLASHGIALIVVGQRKDHLGIPSIVHEERQAAMRAVSHLLDQGRRRIAYVGRIAGSATGTRRFNGYCDALVARGLSPTEDLVWDVVYRYTAGRDAVLAAIRDGVIFDAIQAGSDEMALGAMSALHQQGLDVPKDVAVIGFGGVEWSGYVNPALTTLSNDPKAVAQGLRDAFLSIREREGVRPLTTIERHLLLRQSA